MENSRKTKAQLIDELQVLSDRLAEFQQQVPVGIRGVLPADPTGLYARAPVGLCQLDTDLRFVDSRKYDDALIRTARRAFYALCTHIDHQLRVVIGTLREEGLLDETIIMFLADHGDMLGNHGLWAKRLFYEVSAGVPMILVGTKGCDRVCFDREDNRLVGLQDVMPTLLDLAGIEIPASVDGLSMVGEEKRAQFYGEYGEDAEATRMLHDGRYKLIYFAEGNRLQLFDLEDDPREMRDLIDSETHRSEERRVGKECRSRWSPYH